MADVRYNLIVLATGGEKQQPWSTTPTCRVTTGCHI
jgi:hypothetical protein